MKTVAREIGVTTVGIPRGRGPDPAIVITAEIIAETFAVADRLIPVAIIVIVEEVRQDLDPGIVVYIMVEIDAHADTVAVIPETAKNYAEAVALHRGIGQRSWNADPLNVHHHTKIAQISPQRLWMWLRLQIPRPLNLKELLFLKPGMYIWRIFSGCK